MSNYCSWVPTVGGRLSFSIIGDPQHNRKTKTVNIADDNYRYLICRQQRNLLDSALPFLKNPIVSLLYSYSGTFEFVLIAKADNDASKKDADLKGVMCFYPVRDEGWKNSKANIIECMDKFEEAKEDSNKLAEIYDEQLKLIQPVTIGKNSHFHAEFSLNRAGIVTIDPPVTKVEGSKVPDEFFTDEQERRFASAQLFFFLKDISHVHQHHHARTDTIIDLHVNDPGQKWRHNIIRSLYRKILRFKRAPTEQSCLASLGVLSYLRSFIDVVKKEGLGEDADGIKHLFLNNDNIDKSINVALSKIQAKQNRKTQFWNNLRTVMLGIIGFLISIIGLTSLIEPGFTLQDQNGTLAGIVSYIVDNPGYVIGEIIVGGFIILLITDDIPWRDWDWVTDTVRLVNTLPKKIGGVLLISLSLLGAYIFYRLAIAS